MHSRVLLAAHNLYRRYLPILLKIAHNREDRQLWAFHTKPLLKLRRLRRHNLYY